MDESQSAFLERMFMENYSDLETFAYRFFKNQELAQDAVQETFLIAQIKIDQLMACPVPRGWLFNTLKNVNGNVYKQRQRLEDMVQEEDYDAAEPMELSVLTEYQGAIPTEDLQLLIWIYCDEDTYTDVAERLSISLAACKKRVQRAKSKLKEALVEKI